MTNFHLRFDWIKYNEVSQKKSDWAKDRVQSLATFIERQFPQSHEQSLAMEKLEECFMWIGKAIRNEQLALEWRDNLGRQPTTESDIDSKDSLICLVPEHSKQP